MNLNLSRYLSDIISVSISHLTKMAQEQDQSPQQIHEEVNEVFHYHRWRTSSRKWISQDRSFLTISLSHILSLWSLYNRWNTRESLHISRKHWHCFQHYHIPSPILAPHPTRGRQQTYKSYKKNVETYIFEFTTSLQKKSKKKGEPFVPFVKVIKLIVEELMNRWYYISSKT